MSTSRTLILALSAAASTAMAQPSFADERLSGTWLTEDQSTQVTFKPCGPSDCGQIVWLREPVDPETGKAWLDKLNPYDALKRQPLIGLNMVTDLQGKGPRAWAGTLYNPLDGNSYSGDFLMLDPTKLQLKGCTLAGILCQTETWVRVE